MPTHHEFLLKPSGIIIANYYNIDFGIKLMNPGDDIIHVKWKLDTMCKKDSRHVLYDRSPLRRRASWMSLFWMVTRLA